MIRRRSTRKYIADESAASDKIYKILSWPHWGPRREYRDEDLEAMGHYDDEEEIIYAPDEVVAEEGKEMLNLLEQFPSLAGEQLFAMEWGETSESFYPLACFIFNNFSEEVLDKIYNMYPNALPSEQGNFDSMLEVIVYFCNHVEDDAFIWLVRKSHEDPWGPHALYALLDFYPDRQFSLPLVKAFMETFELDFDEQIRVWHLLTLKKYPSDVVEFVAQDFNEEDIKLFQEHSQSYKILKEVIDRNYHSLYCNFLANKFGLKKVGSGAIESKAEFVDLMSEFMEQRKHEDDEDEDDSDLSDDEDDHTHDDEDGSDEEEEMNDSPVDANDDGIDEDNHDAVTLTVAFSLLKESPMLWCSDDQPLVMKRGRKKRQRRV